MIEQQGRVIALGDGTVTVRLGPAAGCSECEAGRGCGAGIFGRLLQRRPVDLDIAATSAPAVGAAVRVGLPEARLVALVMQMYGWPLVGALVAAIISHYISESYGVSDIMRDLATLAGLLAGGVAAAAWSRRRTKAFVPRSGVELIGTEKGRRCQ